MLSQRLKLAFFIPIFFAAFFSFQKVNAQGVPRKLVIFYSASCHDCAEIKNEFIPQVKERFKDTLEIEYRDTADMEVYKEMLRLMNSFAPGKEIKIPVAYFSDVGTLREQAELQPVPSGVILSGKNEIKEKLVPLLESARGLSPQQDSLAEGKDLTGHFLSFTPLAVAAAGLVDGFNPCAFTVIVFFISFLAFQGWRRRDLIAIGLSFIFAVFLTYLLLGLGLFNFLYRLKGFWGLVKTFNFSVGILSLALGLLCIYDFIKFKRSNNTEGQVLKLPEVVKKQIQKVIGARFRLRQGPSAQEEKRGFLGLIAGAFFTGFLVSLLEAVCTGQMYLPTIAFVLKTTPLKLPAAGYLLLYNIMFTIPLLIVFLFALLGVTSADFAVFLKRRLAMIKLLMALLFLGLGIFLLSGCAAAAETRAPAQSPAAVAEQEESLTWDFGKIKEGVTPSHDFIFKNNSAKTLNIKDVTTSCGCTASAIKKKVLSAGESTVIEVKFDSKGYSGAITQYVYVHTDSLDNPIIRYIIKAEVIAK